MRIKSIHIKGLFDTFEHFIPFNQEDRITIVHAPNGFGKTIILKMLYGLLKMEFSIFEKVPFESFVVTLDNQDTLEVLQEKSKNSARYNYEIFFIDSKVKDVKVRFVKPNESKHSIKSYEDFTEMQKRYENIVKVVTKEYNEEDWNRIMNESKIYSQNENKIPAWYLFIIDNLDIHFIETQRLLTIDNNAVVSSIIETPQEELEIVINSVLKYATELKDIIEDTLNDYATTSQNLERTFPNRLITQQKQENLTIESIKSELNYLEERRKNLQEVGLWDNENLQDMSFQIPENTDAASLNVLSLYIQDAKEKLAVFDSLEKKIALFRNIINSRFQFKQMKIDKKKGFLFLTYKGKNLDSNDLSSGEQHQLVLLYEMLFKVKENDLVLLDEPEISLHITWQEQFLSDLIKIIELNPFDVVITTHAPEIINDRWDLTVGLTKDKENV